MASIFNTDELDVADAYKYAQLTPAEQAAFHQRQAQQGAVQGAENLARGALGLPGSQSQNRGQAGLELRELAKKTAPGTVEFYTAAVDILRKYGLVDEAEKMAKELRTLEIGKGEMSPALKLQRAKDELMKRLNAGDTSVKPAIDAIDKQIAALGTVRAGSTAADPEFIKLLNQYEAALEAGQGDRAALIKQAMEAWLKSHSGKNSAELTEYQRLSLEERRKLRENAEGKTERKNTKEDEAIVSSLQGTLRALDNDLDSAVRLLAHPGLGWITGKWAGLGGRLSAAASSDAAGANALLMNVHAQTFIRALQDLKATSRTGASGLGQLTEREGDKIQNAKVALDPQQPTDQFKRTLASYISQLKGTRQTGAGELTGIGVAVPAAPAPVSDSPRKSVPELAPSATPSPAPAAPKKPKLTATRVQ